MKLFSKTTFVLLFAAVFLFSCESSYDSLVSDQTDENPVPEESTPEGSSGEADFSNYIAIGNSLTAGFMDGALYNMGQEHSLAALIHEQMQYAGAPDNFNQPDINSDLGFNTSVNQPEGGPTLGRYKLDTSIPGPSPTLGGDRLQDTPFTGDKSELNNFGVPGILVGQLLTEDTGNPQAQAYNPFYARFASSPGTSTILADALAAQPTFFTLWIGNNDVLGYAISGASNPNLLTSEQDFKQYFTATINQLMGNTTASGVVGTIPPVSTVPYFQAVTYDAIELSAEEAEQLQTNFDQGLNAILDKMVAAGMHPEDDAERRKVQYTEGANPILVNDPELEDLEPKFDQLEQTGQIDAQQRAALVPYEQSRQLTADELVTLSAGSVLGTEYDGDPTNENPTTIGAIIPLGFPNPQNPELGCTQAQGDECYLTIPEQQQIQDRATTFNQFIAQTVAQYPERLALFDINAGFPGNPNSELGAFADLFGMDGEVGIRIDGQLLQPDFSPNGVFSTDGIHPNARGNAILANEFIRVIEDAFGASIPKVDVLPLPSVQVCAGNCESEQ